MLREKAGSGAHAGDATSRRAPGAAPSPGVEVRERPGPIAEGRERAAAGRSHAGGGLGALAWSGLRAVGAAGARAAGLLWPAGPLRPARPGTRRLAIQVFAPHLTLYLDPVMRELRRDRRIEIHLVILPHPQFSRAERRRLRAHARERWGIPPGNIHVSWWSQWVRFDLFLCVDVFASFPVRRCRRGILMHGAVNPSRCYRPSLLRKTVYDFDVCLVQGPFDEEQFRRHRPPGTGSRALVTGCPPLDEAARPTSSRADYLARLGLDPSRQTVLYAPHFTTGVSDPGDARRRLSEVVEVLGTLGMNLIVKLHAMAYVPGANRGFAWRDAVVEEARAGVAVDLQDSDVPGLIHADVLVSDISSRVFAFMLLGKPTVLLGCPTEGRDEDERIRIALLEQASIRADGIDELGPAVREALEHAPELASARERVARQCFAHVGRSTSATVEALYRELDLEPLDP